MDKVNLTERCIALLLRRRLALMPQVAAWKAAHGWAIEQKEREEELIENYLFNDSVDLPHAHRILPILKAHFTIAKQYQRALLSAPYRTLLPLCPPPHLITTLRPKLALITAELMKASLLKR